MTGLRISAVLLCAVSAACWRQEPPIPSSTPVQKVAALVARVEDPSNQLSEEERAMLHAQLERTARATGSGVGVLIAPSINGETIDNVAQETFSDWHLGDKGVLIVVAMAERRSRIETGLGIERVLTDDLCGQILRDKLRPHLAQGKVYQALHAGVEAIGGILQRASRPLRVGRTYSNGNCALDSNNKLTGLCVGSDESGKACVEHVPAPDSPSCGVGLVPSEIRVAPCSGGGSPVVVSREHQCFWLHE